MTDKSHIYLPTEAEAKFEPWFREAFPGALILSLEGDVDSMCDPGVPILCAETLESAKRESLLRFVARVRPGRPVIVGGTANRDILLDAVNAWQVFRILPKDADAKALVEDVRAALEAMNTELDVARLSGVLGEETEELQRALDELEAAESQLLHQERLSTLGRITGGLIPLMSSYLGKLDAFEAKIKPIENELDCGDFIDAASQGIRSIRALLDDIRGYANNRPGTLELNDEELDTVVERVVAFGKFDSIGKTRKVTTSLKSDVTLPLDRYRLHQSLLNLLRNAFQATEQGDSVEVRTSATEDMACIEVQDSGAGMDEATRQKLFEAFYTTKKDGMGLGLQMCQRTIEAHGGRISCESQRGVGTTFKVELPLSPA